MVNNYTTINKRTTTSHPQVHEAWISFPPPPFLYYPPFFKMFIIIRFSSFDNISRRHNTVSVEQLWTKNTRIIHDV